MKRWIFFCWIFSIPLIAQPSWQWALNLGGLGGEDASGICAYGETDIILTGSFEQSFTVNGNSFNSLGANDLFICRVNPYGNINWLVAGGSMDDDEITAPISDSQGSIYFAGKYWDNIQWGGFSLDRTRGSNSALFVSKWNGNGQVQWLKNVEGSGVKTVTDVAIDSEDNLWVTGYFSDTLFIDQQILTTLSSIRTGFLIKYNSDGLLQWVKSMNVSIDARPNALTIDSNNQAYLAGSFRGDLNFATTTITTNTNDTDAFVLQYDSDGTPQWIVKAGGVEDDVVVDLVANEANEIWLLGQFLGVLKMDDLEIQTIGFNDNIFISTIDPTGNVSRLKSLGDVNNEYPARIAAFENELSITGYFLGSTNLGGEILTTTPNDYNGFLARLDLDGNVIEAQSFGGDDFDLPREVSYDANGEIYVAGSFQNNMMFDAHGLTSNGSFDVFIARFGLSTKVENFSSISDFNVFPNPVNSDIYISFYSKKNQALTFSLVDLLGREQLSFSKHLGIGIQEISYPLLEISRGTYFLNLMDEEGNLVGRGMMIFKE